MNVKSTRNLLSEIASKLETDDNIKSYESKLIVSHVAGLDFSELMTSIDVKLNEKQNGELNRIIKERNLGKPIAYVLNSVAFRDLDLYVDERVLIPRPETEYLVEIAMQDIKQMKQPLILDMGTGSGAIALSIAHEHKNSNLIAVDVSEPALEVARLNCAAVGSSASRVEFMQSDLFESIEPNKQFDVIISNPPYVSKNELVHESVSDFEPKEAVFSGDDGLFHLEYIIENSKEYLKPEGIIFLEMGETQAKRVQSIANENNFEAEIIKDLTSRDRFAKLTPSY